ncbi:MAG: M20/M25/M40 family metallo-hydrolase [Ignavibacterium sp.]
MKKLFFCFFFLSSICIYFPQQNNISFSKDFYKKHIEFLGSDLLEGRGTGTTGSNLSAKYLALEFSKLNLQPIGADNTYYQYVPMHGSIPTNESELKIFYNEKEIHFKFMDDYVLLKSGEQTFIPNPLLLVFVGYGIIAPEYDYNDYQNIDVENKVVVFIDGEPNSEDKDFFNGENQTIYSSIEAKQRIALSRGAKGSILIPNIKSENEWQKYINDFSFEDVTLAYTITSNLSIIINPKNFQNIFNGTDYSIDKIYDLDKKGEMKSFSLKTKLSFKGKFQERDFIDANIIGMLEGSDTKLKDRYVIVSSHYDHLGIGKPLNGDSIYNGVFDNAMGVSALLELARIFSQSEIKPKRTIIFLLVTGEEKGLLGSTFYIDNPIKPLYKTIANINIDGIAAFDRFKSVVGVGAEYSSLKIFLKQTADEMNLHLTDIPPIFLQSESYTKSDQWAFARAGIPSTLIMEGNDYENISKDEGIKKFIYFSKDVYHTPFDDLSQEINYDAVIQHLNVLFNFIIKIANSEIEPEWNKGSPFINARLRSKAEKK